MEDPPFEATAWADPAPPPVREPEPQVVEPVAPPRPADPPPDTPSRADPLPDTAFPAAAPVVAAPVPSGETAVVGAPVPPTEPAVGPDGPTGGDLDESSDGEGTPEPDGEREAAFAGDDHVPSDVRARWANSPLSSLGELTGRRMDRRAININERRIAKLEPEWRFFRRVRSLIVLVVLTLLVAAVLAALLAIAVEAVSVAVNHAVSKSAGA